MGSLILQVITFISAGYGAIVALIQLYHFLIRWGAFVKEPHISADQFFKYVNKLVEAVKEKNIPDVIVGVGRGGSIVAATISANILKNKEPIPIATLEWGFRDAGDKYIKSTTNVSFKNKHVVLCLAEDYFGELVTKAKSFLEKEGAEVHSVAVYSTFHDIVSRMDPDKITYEPPDTVGKWKNKKCKLPWEKIKYRKTSKIVK